MDTRRVVQVRVWRGEPAADAGTGVIGSNGFEHGRVGSRRLDRPAG
jgi:hypothetical protein